MNRDDIVKTINNLKGEEGHQKVLDVYNSQCPLPRGYKLQAKDPWCAATVSAVFIMNDYPDIAECSCPIMTKKAKDLGIWVENDAYMPDPGDVVMYDWQDSGIGDNQGNSDHVGIVIKVNAEQITVREGNKNKSVGNRVIDVNGKYIRGFIVPPYEAEKEMLEQDIAEISHKEEKAQSVSYEVGKTYTICVSSYLNVRRGAGMNFAVVGYNNLTPDGKKHAIGSALKNGTRVTCQQVIIHSDDDIWIKIPSGWICAVSGSRVYVK